MIISIVTTVTKFSLKKKKSSLSHVDIIAHQHIKASFRFGLASVLQRHLRGLLANTGDALENWENLH